MNKSKFNVLSTITEYNKDDVTTPWEYSIIFIFYKSLLQIVCPHRLHIDSPSVAVGYDISSLKRVKLKILTTSRQASD